ncbi:MAG: hypothetical protein KKG47_16490 [Proteobacteria bacterium]|nr:hypothetical protein [Pseudomonadota bacterium]MBU1739658.1 hypothetical protein [Pseudomonadota bacterium]
MNAQESSTLKIVKKLVSDVGARNATPVQKAKVVNALNRINFQGSVVYVTLKRRRYRSQITLSARPAPCRGGTVTLFWCLPDKELPDNLALYEFGNFFYTDGLKKVRVGAAMKTLSATGVELELTDASFEVNVRAFRRFQCMKIATRITQSNLELHGVLKDFNAAGFAVDVSNESLDLLHSLNIENPVYIMIGNHDEILFAEVCRVIRVESHGSGRSVVLGPGSRNIQRFRSKQSRSVRQKLSPQPSIVFRHPFLEKKISLKTLDISGSGLAVEEEPSNTLLMPGMIIPDAAITFSGNFKIMCKAQVLFNIADQKCETCKCGLVYLDMDVENQLQLSSILYQAKNESSYVGGDVDLDDLWDFFFDTGFIYPEKYGSIEEQRDKFKNLYARLYNDCPDIARHIIYKDKGIIYGHVSMFRYYNRTWLLHHHAAVRSTRHKAGLVVMDHILQHINEVHNLNATAMRYIACYFRPNNRFANKSFGGASRSLEDPRKSSLDEFAYFHYHARDRINRLPPGWLLMESCRDDFAILESCYHEISGGLMLEGLDLNNDALEHEREIDETYRELGFKRCRKFFSLKNEVGELGVMFILNHSDTGLNMSSLTNCIQVIVLDSTGVCFSQISMALGTLCGEFGDEASVLLFPRSYADEQQVQYDNIYTLGILDLKYISRFLEYMENLTRSPLRLAKT